jgi:Holliday junction DNA helicase RuvB
VSLIFLLIILLFVIVPILKNIQKGEEGNVKKEIIKKDFEKEKEEPKIYRPTTFSDYIGQKKAKNILKNYIKGTQKRGRIFPHLLINGNAGTGKTTLAEIMSNELAVPMLSTIASNIDNEEKIKQYISTPYGGILFLDEIHALKRELAEKFYTVMEDFKISNQQVKPFTLIGATTELGEIIKDRRPFYDRFKIILTLEEYKLKDMVNIMKKYKIKMFPKEKISDDIYYKLAKNTRKTPRLAIRLLEACIYFDKKVIPMLRSFKIIKDGFTFDDYKVLKYLSDTGDKVGLQGISSYLGLSVANYLFQIEPYLSSQGLIKRTPRGRQISDNGKKKKEELEKELAYV